MNFRFAALASAIAVLGAAPLASAAVVDITYQGTVQAFDSNYNAISAPVLDIENLFGGDLEGDAITASYVYNTSLGIASTNTYTYSDMTPFPGPDVELDGGIDFGASSPILSATFTINGYSYTYAPDYAADVSTGYGVFDFTDQGNDVFGTSDSAEALSGADSEVVFSTFPNASTDLAAKYSSDGFGLGVLDTALGALNESDVVTFGVTSVSVSGTPEPSTWALMIAGLGVAGFALRRRNGVQPASARAI